MISDKERQYYLEGVYVCELTAWRCYVWFGVDDAFTVEVESAHELPKVCWTGKLF